MAYLRWGDSPWFAYTRAACIGEDDGILVAWHERGACTSVRASELFRAGCEGQLPQLRNFMASRFGADETMTKLAMNDIDTLAPAVDQFLFEITNAGKIPMPSAVAKRYRELAEWIRAAVAQPFQARVMALEPLTAFAAEPVDPQTMSYAELRREVGRLKNNGFAFI